MKKRWQVKPSLSDETRAQFPNIDPVVLQLLHNRGIKTQREIDEFLNPDYLEDLHDPFLFSDMEKAANRILTAVKNGEKIIIHGDYDADGITSSTVLHDALRKLGAKGHEIYIPHREDEGYGLGEKGIEYIIEKRTGLVITVDCGIRSREPVAYLKEKGIDIIVTDHHEPPEKKEDLPDCLIINPKLSDSGYSFRDLAGVGVVFKLVQALFRTKLKEAPDEADALEAEEKWLLDIVAIGTIADCMPIIGENRTIVKYGLIVLNKTRRIGLKKLLQIAGIDTDKELDTYSIGFQIAPRLNAAGRMDHANKAIYLLMADSEKEAERLAEDLEKTNRQRQELTNSIVAEAKEQIKDVENKKILFIEEPEEGSWPIGILGLVAGKISDRFYRPTLVMRKNKGFWEGSGRSIAEFDLIEALEDSAGSFERFGGHAQACGFSIAEADLDAVKESMGRFAANKMSGLDLTPVLDIDMEIRLSDVNWDIYDCLDKFRPFGPPNSRALFLLKGLKIVFSDGVGQEKKHLRLNVSDAGGSTIRKCIGFCMGDPDRNGGVNWCEAISQGDVIDMVAEIDVNEWNGNRELQLKMVDLKKDQK